MSQNQPNATQPASATASPATTSRELFDGARELLIRHNDDTYRLRITRKDKLILIK